MNEQWQICSPNEAPPGLGLAPVQHGGTWYVGQSGPGWFRALRWGMGAAHATLPNPQNRPEINAAIDLLAYLDANGCTQASLPVVASFQTAYNASGLPGRLTVDGQYGGNTERALQNAMNEAQNDAGSGPSQQATPNCFGMTVPTIPAVDVTPVTPPPVAPATPPVAPPPSAPMNWTPLLIGGAVVVGAGGIYYAYWRKHHRRGR